MLPKASCIWGTVIIVFVELMIYFAICKIVSILKAILQVFLNVINISGIEKMGEWRSYSVSTQDVFYTPSKNWAGKQQRKTKTNSYATQE